MAQGRTHLTPVDRCQIEVLLKGGESHRAIAKLLGRCSSSIRREINRNSCARGYLHHESQKMAEVRRSESSQCPLKMTPEMIVVIEKKLTQEQWSPEQISGWMKKTAIGNISHERIYQHVWCDKKNGGTLYKHFRHSGKKYNKRKGKTYGRGLIPNRIDIDQSPIIVAEKSRIGDWEIDTVIGAQHKGVLVTAVDRATKFTVIELVKNKSAEAVTEALNRRLGEFPDKVLTITADNGKEFAWHEKISAALNAMFYFATPYHSWERGLNEHTNGLIRQYLPKGQPFDTLTAEEVEKIERLLNNRPRKVLGYKTPIEAFSTPPPGAFHC